MRRPPTLTSSASNCFAVAGGEAANQIPPGRRAKRDPLPLALDDHPHGDALHAAGRQLRPDLSPQQLRNFVAVEPVENAARFLGPHQAVVDARADVPGRRESLLRDFVKHQAMDRHFRLEHLAQVPTDGFPFAVFVRRQIEFAASFSSSLSLATCGFLSGGTI